MWASIRLRSIASVGSLDGAPSSTKDASRLCLGDVPVADLGDRQPIGRLGFLRDWVDAFGHSDELLVGDGARLLDSHQPIAPDDDPPGSAIGGAILDDEALEARRHDLHAEASQLAIPEKMLPNLDPNLGRFRRFDGVNDAFCKLFASHISDLLEF